MPRSFCDGNQSAQVPSVRELPDLYGAAAVDPDCAGGQDGAAGQEQEDEPAQVQFNRTHFLLDF